MVELGISTVYFHEHDGAYTAYRKNISENHSQYIAVKSLVIQGSLEKESRKKGESILSFPSLDLAIFLVMNFLTYEEDKEPYPVIVAFSTDIKSQFLLYRRADSLSKASKQIFNIVQDIFSKKNTTNIATLKKATEKRLGSIATEEWLKSVIRLPLGTKVKDNDTSKASGTVSVTEQSIKNLKISTRMIKKNFSHAVYEIIVGNPIAVISDDQEIIKIIINALEMFSPHKELRINPWIDNESTQVISEGWDIIGVPKAHANDFKDITRILVDKGRVYGGKANQWCANFVEEVLDNQDKSEKLINMLIKRRIDWILMNVSSLLEVIDEDDRKKINMVTEKLDSDSLYLVSKILEIRNPIAYQVLKGQFSLKERILRRFF